MTVVLLRFAVVEPFPVAPLKELLVKLYQALVLLSCIAKRMSLKPEPPASDAVPEKLMLPVTTASKLGVVISTLGGRVSLLEMTENLRRWNPEELPSLSLALTSIK